jgi:hypothetical protein
MATPKITHSELLSIIHYDPTTGVFTNKVDRGAFFAGERAGSRRPDKMGYLKISLRCDRIYLHRLAWFYVHGVWPNGDIDHIDGVKSNNAISNLRVATRSENTCNKGPTRRNTTGYKGVSYDKRRKKYVAHIKKDYRSIGLGRYDTAQEAYAAYCSAARALQGVFSYTK